MDAIHQASARTFLEGIFPSYDFDEPHFENTPKRFVKMLRELTNPESFDFTTFPSESDEMVVVKDIPFTALCAHHIVPFLGYAHIGYIPDGRLAGLSKFGRLVRHHAAALTVQEELTADIANSLQEQLEPLGTAVVLEAEHLCMTIRGVQMPGAKTITSKMSGVFADHDRLARTEFLRLIGK